MTTPEEFRAYRERQKHAKQARAKVRREGMSDFVTVEDDGTISVNVEQMPKLKVCVYFIRCQQFIKIGMTTEWRNRLSSLQTANPIRLEPLAVFEGGADEEARLHKLFAEHRHRADGEWFHECQQILDYIDANKGRCLL